ncbi:DUF2321 domain-containing protein [Lactobacillus apis]|uniref:DUF2321 domain-containing protein n=1 Tax=Lactobacillus apis TaxID=303541 RepID=UPI001C9CF6DF|nr:DUF2321 domain-containing protein [Lactobacillus apis]
MDYKQSICLNGHQASVNININSVIDSFCTECGAKLITNCMNCDFPIEGDWSRSGAGFVDLTHHDIPIPKYCVNCGKPYPWTQSALNAINEMVNLSELNSNQKDDLKGSIPDLLSDTPKSKLAVFKWKNIGKTILPYIHDIIVEVASESIVKALYSK